MIDSKDLKIKGEVIILENSKEIYKNHNEIIVNNALEILLKSLGTQQNVGVDIIRITGVNGSKDISITQSNFIDVEKAIQFFGIVSESDFNGYINMIELVSSQTDNVFARRANLNIYKDDAHKLQVLWKITLNLNI